MGVGMIFLGAEIGDFSKNLLGGPKWMKVVFFPLETKKTTFYLKFSKSTGATASLTPPYDAHGSSLYLSVIISLKL